MLDLPYQMTYLANNYGYYPQGRTVSTSLMFLFCFKFNFSVILVFFLFLITVSCQKRENS